MYKAHPFRWSMLIGVVFMGFLDYASNKSLLGWKFGGFGWLCLWDGRYIFYWLFLGGCCKMEESSVCALWKFSNLKLQSGLLYSTAHGNYYILMENIRELSCFTRTCVWDYVAMGMNEDFVTDMAWQSKECI